MAPDGASTWRTFPPWSFETDELNGKMDNWVGLAVGCLAGDVPLVAADLDPEPVHRLP